MSRYGDLVGGVSVPSTPVDTAPASVEPDPVVELATSFETEQVDTFEEDDGVDLESMSKVDLEEYGRTLGIELDRRKNKGKLIEQIYDKLAEL